jgi:hypothetical protein
LRARLGRFLRLSRFPTLLLGSRSIAQLLSEAMKLGKAKFRINTAFKDT